MEKGLIQELVDEAKKPPLELGDPDYAPDCDLCEDEGVLSDGEGGTEPCICTPDDEDRSDYYDNDK